MREMYVQHDPQNINNNYEELKTVEKLQKN